MAIKCGHFRDQDPPTLRIDEAISENFRHCPKNVQADHAGEYQRINRVITTRRESVPNDSSKLPIRSRATLPGTMLVTAT